MTLLHAFDGVLVEFVVGGNGSSLGSLQSLEGLDEVVLGDSVSVGGLSSKGKHVSSVGSSSVHGASGLDVSRNGSSVVVEGSDVLGTLILEVSDGLSVVCFGLFVVLLSELDLLFLVLEFLVSSVEVGLGNGHSVSPVLGHALSVVHHFSGVVSSSDGSVVDSGNLFVVSNSGNHDLNGMLEVMVPFEENLVSPGSHVLASEVGDSLVTSGSLEFHVLVHPLHSGRFGHLEVSLGVEEGEVTEVAGSGTSGSRGHSYQCSSGSHT